MTDSTQGLKYGSPDGGNHTETLKLSGSRLGQSYPQHYPQSSEDPLGPPLTIGEAAAVIGCSIWAIRQRYIPLGLPHLRIGKAGKFTFYRHQITRWILQRQQQKGGRL